MQIIDNFDGATSAERHTAARYLKALTSSLPENAVNFLAAYNAAYPPSAAPAVKKLRPAAAAAVAPSGAAKVVALPPAPQMKADTVGGRDGAPAEEDEPEEEEEGGGGGGGSGGGVAAAPVAAVGSGGGAATDAPFSAADGAAAGARRTAPFGPGAQAALTGPRLAAFAIREAQRGAVSATGPPEGGGSPTAAASEFTSISMQHRHLTLSVVEAYQNAAQRDPASAWTTSPIGGVLGELIREDPNTMLSEVVAVGDEQQLAKR
jgi:hypothetical protein